MRKIRIAVTFLGLGVLVAGCEQPASGSAFMDLDPYLGAFNTKLKLDQDIEANYELDGVGVISGVVGIDDEQVKAYGGYTLDATSIAGKVINYVPNQNTSFLARYELARAYDINKSTYFLTGSTVTASGAIELYLDMDSNTLSGTGGNLTLDTKFDGSQISGTGSYRDVPLSVKGEFVTGGLPMKGVIGAFHGHTETDAVGGGFVGTEFYASR